MSTPSDRHPTSLRDEAPRGLSGQVHPDFAPVASLLRRQLARRPGSGAAICVIHRGECVVDIWGGVRDAQGQPWDRDTLSLSFSTTKGVVSTLLHVLVDRGALDYDDRVAAHWPEFAAGGKENVTVRQLLAHQAGLYDVRRLVAHASEMLDWERMVTALEAAAPEHPPGERHGYHGLTWGWLVGELVRRVSGRCVSEAVQDEIARPLGLDGLFVGRLPAAARARRADLVEHRMGSQPLEAARRQARRLGRGLRAVRVPFDVSRLEGALLPPGIEELDWNSEAVADACIPAANGYLDARSLARMYAVLAAGGERDGVKLVRRETQARFSQVQQRGIGLVVPFPMNWRLGYHRIPVPGREGPRPFGHFGFGGSGAWADPHRDLAVACVLNAGVGTPFGDTRIVRLGVTASRIADRR